MSWKTIPLGSVATLQRGFDLPADSRREGPYPVISSGGLTGYHSQAKVSGPGVVTGRYGSVGEVYYVEQDFWPLNTTLWVKDFHGNEPRFIYELLTTLDFQKFSDKTGVPGVNRNDLHKITMICPPLDVQKRIVVCLRAWDLAIEKTKQLISAKEERNGKLLANLLFGGMRLDKRTTNGQLRSKWFSVPADWRAVKIGSIAREVNRRNRSGDEIPVLSCTKHKGLVDSLEYFDRQIFSKDTSPYKVVEYGEFAYATNHIEEGSIGYQGLYPKGLVSPMYTVFKADQKQMHDGYLYKLLKTETFRHIFEINTSASVDRRGSLRWKEFSALPVPLPGLAEQTEIAEAIGFAEKEVALLQNQLALLKLQKRGLMQKLLTGEWRVKTDDPGMTGETESNRGDI
jgi:type I restriction enzyme, S subunit